MPNEHLDLGGGSSPEADTQNIITEIEAGIAEINEQIDALEQDIAAAVEFDKRSPTATDYQRDASSQTQANIKEGQLRLIELRLERGRRKEALSQLRAGGNL